MKKILFIAKEVILTAIVCVVGFVIFKIKEK